MLACLRRAISPRNYVQPSKTTGLVIGAGGMARAAIYALIRLGCRNIFIYNRTLETAQKVADHFNDWAISQGIAASTPGDGQSPSTLSQTFCHVLPSLSEAWPSNYSPPTMIVSCVPATSVDGKPQADFEMPLQWLRSPTGGVVVEVSNQSGSAVGGVRRGTGPGLIANSLATSLPMSLSSHLWSPRCSHSGITSNRTGSLLTVSTSSARWRSRHLSS